MVAYWSYKDGAPAEVVNDIALRPCMPEPEAPLGTNPATAEIFCEKFGGEVIQPKRWSCDGWASARGEN